jgi:protoheme ferro-lyase
MLAFFPGFRENVNWYLESTEYCTVKEVPVGTVQLQHASFIVKTREGKMCDNYHKFIQDSRPIRNFSQLVQHLLRQTLLRRYHVILQRRRKLGLCMGY